MLLMAILVFIGGIVFLIIINYFIQKRRALKFYDEGYRSVVDRGFKIEKIKENNKVKYKIIPDSKPSIIF